MTDQKKHWENVYETKSPKQVSWTQEIPSTSLNLIKALNLEKDAKIIDVGGGDSKLVDHLLEEGYRHVTVLDISAKAIDRAKQRLGEAAAKVNWIVSDITAFEPTEQYDLWHDRAAFHFLTEKEHINKYNDIINKAVNGYIVMGTFSENGPLKCSGLDITQYNEKSLGETLKGFERITCLTEDHTTPFDTTQNFIFCSFKKK
jgi:SAM-dependent methyltransferase